MQTKRESEFNKGVVGKGVKKGVWLKRPGGCRKTGWGGGLTR